MLIDRRKRKIVGLLAFGLAAVLAVSAYAFTASNTVAAHHAGAGAGGVTGYTVSWGSTGDGYTWDNAGTHMVGVKFDLDNPASDVQVALTPGTPTAQSNWTDCGAAVGTGPTYTVTCTFNTPVANGNGDKLTVAAVDNGVVTIAGP